MAAAFAKHANIQKKKKHTCNYKREKKRKETQLKRRGEHSSVMLYFVNNICKSCLPNTSRRKFMIELLHVSILY